jgi:hypothetical protein
MTFLMLLLVALFSYAFALLRVALLPLAAALLLEELTYGGLVRLLLAPRPVTGSCAAHGGKVRAPARKRGEPNHRTKVQTEIENRGGKCSH